MALEYSIGSAERNALQQLQQIKIEHANLLTSCDDGTPLPQALQDHPELDSKRKCMCGGQHISVAAALP